MPSDALIPCGGDLENVGRRLKRENMDKVDWRKDSLGRKMRWEQKENWDVAKAVPM